MKLKKKLKGLSENEIRKVFKSIIFEQNGTDKLRKEKLIKKNKYLKYLMKESFHELKQVLDQLRSSINDPEERIMYLKNSIK
jgi:uncharacterized protein YPO0396